TVPGWGERPRPHLRRWRPHAAPTSCRCPAGPGPGTLGLCPAPCRDPGGGPHMTEGVGGACGGSGGGSGGSGGSTVISLPGRGSAGGGGWAGLGGAADARPPDPRQAAGIMGNGMTKVGERDSRRPPLVAPTGPGAGLGAPCPPLTFRSLRVSVFLPPSSFLSLLLKRVSLPKLPQPTPPASHRAQVQVLPGLYLGNFIGSGLKSVWEFQPETGTPPPPPASSQEARSLEIALYLANVIGQQCPRPLCPKTVLSACPGAKRGAGSFSKGGTSELGQDCGPPLQPQGVSHPPAPGGVPPAQTQIPAPWELMMLDLNIWLNAKDLDQLGRNKITHIISIHESPQPLLQDITYLRIPVADTPEVPIKKHFKECINFIHCCRLNGGNCLVHCFAGISRSTTVVTAYVMTVTGLGWRDVLEAIKSSRPIANPNPGFRQQLEEFGWGNSRKLRRLLEERFGESPFRDEEEVRALLPLCKRCRQGSATASTTSHASASEGTLQRLVQRTPRETHRPLPLLARVKQTFSCLPRCLSRKGGNQPLLETRSPSKGPAFPVGWRIKEQVQRLWVAQRPGRVGVQPSRAQTRALRRCAPMVGEPWRREDGKVLDGRRPMVGTGGPLRLRDWLVAQIESGRYAGLRWEDAGKTLFRIPWKHAAKHGYQAQQDAALFRAWAIYKGKHLEGVDKEDPPTWKTRLRCALNKSADFCEVRECSQLDISNPYKVYRIVSDGAHGPGTLLPRRQPPSAQWSLGTPVAHRPPSHLMSLSPNAQEDSRLATEDKDKEQPPRLAQRGSLPPAALLPGPLADHRYQAQDPTQHWNPSPSEDFSNPDCWLHVRLFYGAELVSEATARTAEGCCLSPGAAAERLLGWPARIAQIRFPEPPPGARVLQRLLPHLERGVLLWVAPEGVFAKRLCQGRVYWRGPLAPHRAQPNKLERERTCQLLDMGRFLAELRAHLQDGCPEPEYQIRLCFGEEYPGPEDQPEQRLIMAHVEPVFARELLLHFKRHSRDATSGPVPSPACLKASLI
ncbi:Dual specificity protein phosphatase 15, partial [Galemys pyrenaicus]